MKDKDFTVEIYIDGKTTTYENCDQGFIIELITCPCCVGEEYSITIYSKAFAEKKSKKAVSNGA